MISRTLSLFWTSALSLALLFTGTEQTQAATVSSGTLIKASGPAVYYFSTDSKRYAFPDQSTYSSWYTDFSGVQTLSDTDLAQIPFGGVVTIRPGSRMVKIQTDPRVYAVARGGILRWVQTEALARALYGEQWNRQVSDVPDAFFTNYRIQAEIAQSTDFSPSIEQTSITSIGADITARAVPTNTIPITPTSTPITPTSTPIATSTSLISGRIEILTNGTLTAGDPITVLASVARGFADRITLSLGTSTPATCSTSPCRGEFTLPLSQTTSTLTLQAVFSIGEGPEAASSTATLNITVLPNHISSAIFITAPQQVIRHNDRTLRAEVNETFSPRTIKLMVDDIVIRECSNVQSCELTQQEVSPAGTRHQVYAIVTNELDQRLFSPLSTFEVVQ